jgi:hypothetical protein
MGKIPWTKCEKPGVFDYLDREEGWTELFNSRQL